MKNLMENLVKLQSLEFDPAAASHAPLIAELRGKIPARSWGITTDCARAARKAWRRCVAKSAPGAT